MIDSPVRHQTLAPYKESQLAGAPFGRSGHRLRPLSAKTAETVILLAGDGLILYVSDAVAPLLGYAPEDLLGRNEIELLHPDDYSHLKATFAESLAKLNREHIVEFRYLHKNGSWRYLQCARSTRLTDNRIRIVVVLQKDITARKTAETTVLHSEAHYRGMLDGLEQSVFLKDPSLKYVAANNRFCDSLGIRKADIVGKTDEDLHESHLAKKYREDDLLVLNESKRIETEQQCQVNGELRTLRIAKTPFKDDRGQTTGILGIVWDVTDQRNLEMQLRQAQKMEAIGQLAGGMAHDFNNLLTAIMGNISLTLGAMPADDSARELLLAAEDAVDRAAELTNRLLGFSRQTILRTRPLDLNQCITETVGILRRTIDPRISLETDPAADVWTVLGDSSQISQVLMNLCLNARDAMPDGGRLVMRTANVNRNQAKGGEAIDARAGEFVCLSVEDNGHGILPEIRSRIFEPFFTTKAPGKGTGLGLAMVFGIIKQHQGWIECSSQVSVGTRFDIYLPRQRDCTASRPPAEPVAPPAGGKETILVADDEPMIRTLARTILTRHGYEVLLAEDGQEAVDIYRRAGKKINLVILDLTMPRLSGHDAFRQITQIDPKAAVLFASGFSAEHVDEQENDKILGFVSKPYRPDDLARAVREGLDSVKNLPPS